MSKILLAILATVAIVGCAAYKPVPEGYTGPVAVISDTGFPEGSSKAQLFAVVEIDGNRVPNSFAASAQASSGQGFRLTIKIVDREVPTKPIKLLLRAGHTTAAPIQAIFSQASGSFLSVEGTVDFTPKPNGRYVVRGELKQEESSVWIADSYTNEPVTEKIVKR